MPVLVFNLRSFLTEQLQMFFATLSKKDWTEAIILFPQVSCKRTESLLAG